MDMRVALKDFVEVLQDNGYDNARFTDDYSGRFMYGNECCGVVGPEDMDVELFAYLVDEGVDAHDAKNFIKSARWDNMGLSYIMYWPQVSIDAPYTIGED